MQERQREELAKQISEEEKKVKDLETWVAHWQKAQQMRDFIAALEVAWAQQGHDLWPETQKGQWITWMKRQADRLDPRQESPLSILDRRVELNR